MNAVDAAGLARQTIPTRDGLLQNKTELKFALRWQVLAAVERRESLAENCVNTASARVQKISEAVSCREARAARNAPCNNSSTPRDDVRVVGFRGRGLEPRRAEAEPGVVPM